VLAGDKADGHAGHIGLFDNPQLFSRAAMTPLFQPFQSLLSDRLARSTMLERVPCKTYCSPWLEIQAGLLSLQPEVFGAGQEATNDLKPSENELFSGVDGPRSPQRE